MKHVLLQIYLPNYLDTTSLPDEVSDLHQADKRTKQSSNPIPSVRDKQIMFIA